MVRDAYGGGGFNGSRGVEEDDTWGLAWEMRCTEVPRAIGALQWEGLGSVYASAFALVRNRRAHANLGTPCTGQPAKDARKNSRTPELKNSRTQELKNSRTQELKISRPQELEAQPEFVRLDV